MKFVPFALLAVLVLAALLLRGMVAPAPMPPMPKGIPVAALASGKPQPQLGLTAPLPKWIPLPIKGWVIGAGLYPPQPPWGAAAVVMLRIDGTPDGFLAAYGQRLAEAGFAMRRVPIPPNLIIDAADSAFEADEHNGGHVVYVTMRRTYYVQLTFWGPPAPRVHP